jgi:hypothetical protein
MQRGFAVRFRQRDFGSNKSLNEDARPHFNLRAASGRPLDQAADLLPNELANRE